MCQLFIWYIFDKKSLKIPKRYLEVINGKRRENMYNIKKEKGQKDKQ